MASLRGVGETTGAYIDGHTQRNMQWPQKFGSCHKAGMLVFHHESWPCYGCILFMPWRLLQFNITIDKGVVGTLIHIIGNSYQLSYSFSIIVKSLSKMWQPLASTFCSHRIGSLECQCFGCQKMSTPANLQSSSPVGSLATSAAGFLQPLGLVAVRTIFYALLALLSFWFIFEVVQLGAFFDCYHIGKDWNGDSIHLHGVPHHVDQFWIFAWLAPKEWNNATLLWIVKILDLLERLDDHLEAIELDGQLVVLGQGTGLLGNDLTKWDQLQTILLADLGCGEQSHWHSHGIGFLAWTHMVYLAAFGLAPDSWMAVSTASICLASSGTSRSDLLGLWPISKVSTLVPPTSMVTSIGVDFLLPLCFGLWLVFEEVFLAWSSMA